MAKVSLNTIKNWFKTGFKPTQAQFWDTWDSFLHKDDEIPTQNIQGLDERFNDKADAELLNAHLTDPSAHGLQNKVDKVEGKGLSTEDFTTIEKDKLSSLQNYDDTDVYEQLETKLDKPIEPNNTADYVILGDGSTKPLAEVGGGTSTDIAKVNGLQAALDEKQPAGNYALTNDKNTFTASQNFTSFINITSTGSISAPYASVDSQLTPLKQVKELISTSTIAERDTLATVTARGASTTLPLSIGDAQTNTQAITKGQFDALKIGGRNLIFGGFSNGHWNQASIGTTATNNVYGRTNNIISLTKGQQYTFSMRPDTVSQPNGAWITFRNVDDTYHSVLILDKLPFTFIAPSEKCTISFNANYYTGANGGSAFEALLPKLEIGIKDTDWTPAPEDKMNSKANLDNVVSNGGTIIVNNNGATKRINIKNTGDVAEVNLQLPQGGFPVEKMAGHTEYIWYNNIIRTGIVRDSSAGTRGYAITYNNNNVAQFSHTGQLQLNNATDAGALPIVINGDGNVLSVPRGFNGYSSTDLMKVSYSEAYGDHVMMKVVGFAANQANLILTGAGKLFNNGTISAKPAINSDELVTLGQTLVTNPNSKLNPDNIPQNTFGFQYASAGSPTNGMFLRVGGGYAFELATDYFNSHNVWLRTLNSDSNTWNEWVRFWTSRTLQNPAERDSANTFTGNQTINGNLQVNGKLSANNVVTNDDTFTSTPATNNIVTLTQAEYNALSSKNSNTLYIVI